MPHFPGFIGLNAMGAVDIAVLISDQPKNGRHLFVAAFAFVLRYSDLLPLSSNQLLSQHWLIAAQLGMQACILSCPYACSCHECASPLTANAASSSCKEKKAIPRE
jgi:hypothetical protein